FRQDANDVMQLLLKAQTDANEMEDDDPQISFMISAWARMCKLLGTDFQAYLPVVMGPLMKTASIKPEVALVDILCLILDFVELVRLSAAESLPYLLECAKIKGDDYLAQMWSYILPEVLKAIQTEPESDVLVQHMDSFAKCVEFLGKGCLDETQLATLAKLMGDILDQHFKRHADRQEQRKDEDYDEVVEENLQDESADRPWADHQWAICIFDDLLEYCGPVKAISFLTRVIQDPQSREPENVNATENAISAVTKIMKHNHGNINVEELLPHWLSWLPVVEDKEECIHIYSYFCDLIESNNVQILGANNSNSSRILAIIAEVFLKDATCEDNELTQRLINIVRQIQSNAELWNVCTSQLSEDQKQSLATALQMAQ
ncbi:importin-5-like, partial [Saccoglossus kowalevskii]